MDCAQCYYPNDDDSRFCVRCATPLGVPLSQLPTQLAPAPEGLDQLLTALAGPAGSPGSELSPEAFAEALAAAEAAREAMLPAGSPPAAAALAPAGPLDGPLLGGRYRLLRCLGSGGFGAVYEAEDATVGLRVAIKLLNRSALADARTRERFLQEARMIAQLRSPHVVVLHDYAVTPRGMPYLVMELLRGKPLSHDMMRGVLSPRRSLQIMAQVCAALGEAHALGIVHRDIKPDNILLLPGRPRAARPAQPLDGSGLFPLPSSAPDFDDSPTDFVKVVDFGVARLCGPETRASDILGTPAYIAPETLASEPVDGRCDLYAVGMLLWQMIVGDLPFPGQNQAVMMKSHLEAPRRWPRLVNPRVRLPEALEVLMTRLIARHPSERPASAYQVRAELEAILASTQAPEQVPVRPLREASPPNFGPSWDAPIAPAASQSAVTVRSPIVLGHDSTTLAAAPSLDSSNAPTLRIHAVPIHNPTAAGK